MRDAGGHDVVICIRIYVGSEDWRQHVRASCSFGCFVISCLVPFLDQSLQHFGLDPFRLHLCDVEEAPHVGLGARAIERDRVVYKSSRACCWPTMGGSVTVRPKPWWNPRRAKFAEN